MSVDAVLLMSVAMCGHAVVFTYCTALFGKHSLGGSFLVSPWDGFCGVRMVRYSDVEWILSNSAHYVYHAHRHHIRRQITQNI
jgi:hypothetical protein